MILVTKKFESKFFFTISNKISEQNASDEDSNIRDYERERNKTHYKRYEDYHENESPIRNIPKQRSKKVKREHAWEPRNSNDDD